jgi:hypothetical protein
MAQRLVHQVTQVLAPDCAPLFLTDGFREYLIALVTHYGQWIQPERHQAKGPTPKPRWMPKPSLLYAQVVKSYRRRRITGVKHRVVFGAREAIEHILAKRGWKINMALFQAYHNFCLPHASLRLPLPEPIDGTGAVKVWQPRTPAIAAGLTDRVWSLREVLMYRVPPWPQGQMA